jgi:hypothetical protein
MDPDRWDDSSWQESEDDPLYADVPLGNETYVVESSKVGADGGLDTGPAPDRSLVPPIFSHNPHLADPGPEPDPEPAQLVGLKAQASHFGPGSVMDVLYWISGVKATQSTLKSLRRDLFSHILGEMSRQEKRNRRCNIAAFEAHRAEILLILEDPRIWPFVREEFRRGTRKLSDQITLIFRSGRISY